MGHHVLTKFAKRTLWELLDEFGRKLADVADPRLDPVETTHQLRVVSRRADVALRIYKAWIPVARRQRMQQFLKRVRFDAGSVRDLDLLEVRWRPACGDLAAQVSSATAMWVHARIQTELLQARSRLLRWTRPKTACRFARKSMALVRTTGRRRLRLETPVVDRELARLQQSLQESLPESSSSLEQSHQTRIRARRLRYALKLLQPILWVESNDLMVHLVNMQDVLGQINDDVTGIAFLSAMLELCEDSAMKLELVALTDRMRDVANDHLRTKVAELSSAVALDA